MQQIYLSAESRQGKDDPLSWPRLPACSTNPCRTGGLAYDEEGVEVGAVLFDLGAQHPPHGLGLVCDATLGIAWQLVHGELVLGDFERNDMIVRPHRARPPQSPL